MAARARTDRRTRHRGPHFLRPAFIFGDQSSRPRAAGPAIRRRQPQEYADRLARCAALRAQKSGRFATRSPAALDRLFPSRQRRRNPMKTSLKTFYAALALALVTACADPLIKDTRALLNEGRTDEALASLEKATREDPQNHAYRSEYFRLREFATAQWLVQAESLRATAQFEAANELYRRVLKYDAANARATQGLAQIEMDVRHRALLGEADKLVEAGKYRDARDVLAPVLAENPAQREARQLQRLIEEKTTKPAVALLQLRSSVTKPISLELKDVPLRTVFDVIARAANLNFLFDKDVRADQRTTIVVRDAQVEDVIKLILATNQLEQKVLNETTALIYPNTPQKLREYQDLVVKSFYITNADVRQTANLIRTILKTRDIFIDEKLNLL